LQPMIGFYIDRHPRPYSLAVGMGLTLTGLVLFSQAATYPVLLLAAALVLALVSLGVIVLGTGLLLGAHWGDPLAVVALLVAAALAATGISLLTVAFTRTEEQAGSAIAIVSLSLAVVGGSFFPANQGPEVLSQLSLLTPHAWFLDGVSDVSTGGDIVSAAPSILVLLATALVTGGLGMLRARRLVLS